MELALASMWSSATPSKNSYCHLSWSEKVREMDWWEWLIYSTLLRGTTPFVHAQYQMTQVESAPLYWEWLVYFRPPDTRKFLSHLIPILKIYSLSVKAGWTLFRKKTILKIYFWNNDASKDFVNKSTRLSHDFVCHFSVTREDRIV